jgi:hypothetical protein
MSERISRKALEYRIERLNKMLGRPTTAWQSIDNKNKASVGHFHLDHCLGGWQVAEMRNDSGGVGCPFGYRRMTSGELCRMLDAILAAIEIAQKPLAIAIVQRAKTPGNHGCNPHTLPMVQMAERITG